MQITRSFPCTSRAPSAARGVLDELDLPLRDDVMDDLRLVVSELVTNAVLHSRPGPEARVGMTIDATADRVRLEVVDQGTSFVEGGGHPAASDDHGWGLLIVERLVSRWGVLRGPGTTVWAELALAAPANPAG